jgi:sporulation protein YhbH
MIIDHSESDWDLSEKARSDRSRHNKKVDKAIREAARDVIAEEDIITTKQNKTVKIPIRGLKEWRFVYGKNKGRKTGGAGQGKGKPGDVIYKRKKGQTGKAGNEPGNDIIEVEVSLSYLLEIMFDELGLPYLEEKDKIQKYIPSGYRFESISKTGIYPQLHKKRTLLESIKRLASDLREIMDETNCSEEDANRAYYQAHYDLRAAIGIINNGQVDITVDEDISVLINDDDLRFKQIDDNLVPQSQAVVILMCDSSGSMTADKKYLMRGLFFWLVEFLRTKYENVEIRFISHDTVAKLVPEDVFFKKGEGGGTFCYTAFDLASYLIDTEYPINEWNVFCSYVSDGESWDTAKDLVSLESLINKDINMFSYFETHPEGSIYGYSDSYLLDDIVKNFSMIRVNVDGKKEFYRNRKARLFAGIIQDRTDIWPALKFILFGDKRVT